MRCRVIGSWENLAAVLVLQVEDVERLEAYFQNLSVGQE